MPQAKLKVLRNFYKYPGQQLVPFGTNVSVNLDPAVFTSLLVAPKDIKTLADALTTALADALNKDANCVEDFPGLTLEMLLNTGFLPASTNRASSPLDDTAIVSLLNNGTTQALLQLAPVVNAKTYQVQSSTDGGKTWAEACLSTQARRIVLMGLVPGTTYLVRARAIGGSTGASNWCSSGAIMST